MRSVKSLTTRIFLHILPQLGVFLDETVVIGVFFVGDVCQDVAQDYHRITGPLGSFFLCDLTS